MNQVNFLTDSFVQEQTRRARAGHELVLVGAVVLAMFGWGVMSWRQMASLKSQLLVRQDDTSVVQTQTGQFAELTRQCRDLQRQVALQQEMALPLDVTAVIATIAQLAPDSLTVTHMTLSTPKPKPTKSADQDESSGKKKSKKKKKKAKPSSADRQRVLRIDLSGVCPSDSDVADFVDNLMAHQLFSAVKPLHTRSGLVLSAVVREFQIEMVVPLDRLYVPTNEAHKEMADAG